MHDDALRVLEALHGGSSGSFTELRFIDQDRGHATQRFFACDDRLSAAATALERAEELDVFFGVAPRSREEGTRRAVASVPAVWIDLDSEQAAEALAAFDPPPSFVVASGTPGNLHAYWLLSEAVEPAVAEELNKELANALGGDRNATDAARVLRPLSVAESAKRDLCPLVLLRTRLQRRPVVAVEGRRG